MFFQQTLKAGNIAKIDIYKNQYMVVVALFCYTKLYGQLIKNVIQAYHIVSIYTYVSVLEMLFF